MGDTRKTAEKAILAIVKEYETTAGVKVNWVDITRDNHVGFHPDGRQSEKHPAPSKATIKGGLK